MAWLRDARPTRRQVLKQSGLVSAAAALRPWRATGEVSTDRQSIFPHGTAADNLFTQIGVRPIINAMGTYTIITGSRSLPEVKEAMYAASFYFVQLDELMSAVGSEIAKLMGAPGAIVTTGCEAAIALATVACCCGTDPELSQAFPYKKRRSKVIIPTHSRNPYDFGVRLTGVEIVEVSSEDDLHAQLTDDVAMIYIMSSPKAQTGPLSIPNICACAKTKAVPVFVDAAAEEPLVPNIHLQNGATLVGYSGGKCMRGPQAAGVLLGDKDLVQAAWFQAAPHHNFGRALKVGKEEIMGMLAAVRLWYQRDHQAEQRMWRAWLGTIESSVKSLPSVTTQYVEPEDLSNRAPTLVISWDASALNITGTELVQHLDQATPRMMVGSGSGTRPDHMASSISIMPYMLAADDIPILAKAISDGLAHPAQYKNPVVPTGEPVNVAGGWTFTFHFTRGSSQQHIELQQTGEALTGTQQGEIYDAPLQGVIHANELTLHSRMKVGGNQVQWDFTGKIAGDSGAGTVGLGEFGHATWTAVRT
jgi:seryl-tRNA(Sec) selenium transferase